MPIKNLNGGKTFPKKGRLGSGAFYPNGSPINVNPLGPNNETRASVQPTPPRQFGTPSNAGNNTQFGQNRATSGAGLPNPNQGQRNVTQQNRVPAWQADGYSQQPVSPFGPNPVIQPHERNKLPTRKMYGAHHTAFGASGTLPSDTPFHPVASQSHPRDPIKPQTFTLRVPRSQQASFMSRNQLWSDPNNSYYQGKTNPVTGKTGMGRWATVKVGAAG